MSARLSIVHFALSIFVLLIVVGCTKSGKHAEHVDTYTCPMHPTVVSDKPGTCPVCGMDLVRKAREGEEVKITEKLTQLIKSPNEVVVASIKTIKGEFKSMPVLVEAQGIVTYDTRNIYTISARMDGRLEKVYLKYSFQFVQKGQKVAEIYSPELLTAQRELLYLIENDGENSTIIESAKNKLYLLGATSKQVEDIVSSKQAVYTFPIYSSHSGYVINESQAAPVTKAATPSSLGMDGGMGDSGTPSSTPSQKVSLPNPELIREGNYVSAGQTLFKIVNTSALWIELDLPVAQSGGVDRNDEVELDLGNRKTMKTKVDFIQPFFTDGEEFVKLRLYVDGVALRIGQLVNATIQLKPVEALWIPREAMLDRGMDRIVFVKERGIFKPKNIKVGVRSNEWIEIIQGLASSDELAANAQYLVDSESFIKVNN